MNDVFGIFFGIMDCVVDCEICWIDRKFGFIDDVFINIDFD